MPTTLEKLAALEVAAAAATATTTAVAAHKAELQVNSFQKLSWSLERWKEIKRLLSALVFDVGHNCRFKRQPKY